MKVMISLATDMHRHWTGRAQWNPSCWVEQLALLEVRDFEGKWEGEGRTDDDVWKSIQTACRHPMSAVVAPDIPCVSPSVCLLWGTLDNTNTCCVYRPTVVRTEKSLWGQSKIRDTQEIWQPPKNSMRTSPYKVPVIVRFRRNLILLGRFWKIAPPPPKVEFRENPSSGGADWWRTWS
jgi:hypothetical protein